MHTLAGTYEGEGPNTTAAIANVPDVNAAPSGSTENAANTADTAKKAQGRVVGVAMTRRRQLRVSSESARDAVAISVGGGDQTFANASRGVYITTAGNIACRFVDGTQDVTITGLLAGQVYPFALAIIRQTNTTAAGFVLL